MDTLTSCCWVDKTNSIIAETLVSTDLSWDGSPYKPYPDGKPKLSVLKITIPPHTILDWHTHPVPSAGYVLSGYITVEKFSDGTKKTVNTGEVLPETVGSVHRGYTDNMPAVLIVFYAGTEELPLSEPERYKSLCFDNKEHNSIIII